MFVCLSHLHSYIIFAVLVQDESHCYIDNELPEPTLYYETFYFSN